MDEARIFALAGVEPIERLGLRLLKTEAVLRLLAHWEDHGLVVLGLDGFRVGTNGLEPDLNLIADFSKLASLPSGERSRQSIRATREFLAVHAHPGTYLDLTNDGLE